MGEFDMLCEESQEVGIVQLSSLAIRPFQQVFMVRYNMPNSSNAQIASRSLYCLSNSAIRICGHESGICGFFLSIYVALK